MENAVSCFLLSAMIRQSFYLLFFLLGLQTILAQDSIEITGFVEGRAFAFSEDLPFWMYTNTNGFLNRESNGGVSAFAKADYDISTNHSLSLGLGGFLRDGLTENAQRSDLYLKYENTWFTITGGAKSVAEARQGLSTINDNILVTGNARALPGVLLETTNPITIGAHLTLEGQLGHYALNDDRSTDGANVHYKSLSIGWNFNQNSNLTATLRHYVQWGGITRNNIVLPDGFKDFVNVFLGKGATDFDNFNETTNALGNHLGSYELKYKTTWDIGDFELYHQTLFEDRSGRELHNFPDGVSGIHYKPKNSTWLKGFLYEYVQTVSQSGRPRETMTEFGQQSGGDNYFRNGIYRSGWTYEGRTIGLPFILPILTSNNVVNNRSIAHHFGLLAGFSKWEISGKLTFLQNLGTYQRPIIPREKQLLSFAQVSYDTERIGQLKLFLAADVFDNRTGTIGVGLGYRFVLQ